MLVKLAKERTRCTGPPYWWTRTSYGGRRGSFCWNTMSACIKVGVVQHRATFVFILERTDGYLHSGGDGGIASCVIIVVAAPSLCLKSPLPRGATRTLTGRPTTSYHSNCGPMTLKYFITSRFWASFFIKNFFQRLSGSSHATRRVQN